MIEIKLLGDDPNYLFDIFKEKMIMYDEFHTWNLGYTSWNHSYDREMFIREYLCSKKDPETEIVFIGVFKDNKCVGIMNGHIHSNVYAISHILERLVNSDIGSPLSNYNKVALILGVFVDSDCRGLGLAEMMYNYFFQLCQNSFCHLVTTSVVANNIGSMNFHIKMGFNFAPSSKYNDIIIKDIYKVL